VERLILDTGVLVRLEREATIPAETVPDTADLAIAAITAAELLVGVELADGARREARASTVRAILETLEVLPFDLDVARHHAALLAHVRRAGRPRGAHDLQIAATARATGRTLVTTDRGAFDDLPGVEYRLAYPV
jgi:tRNA(fMet)-specific endonuclease VapC